MAASTDLTNRVRSRAEFSLNAGASAKGNRMQCGYSTLHGIFYSVLAMIDSVKERPLRQNVVSLRRYDDVLCEKISGLEAANKEYLPLFWDDFVEFMNAFRHLTEIQLKIIADVKKNPDLHDVAVKKINSLCDCLQRRGQYLHLKAAKL